MASIKMGDDVLFIDSSGKSFLKKIEIRSFHTHHGMIELKNLEGEKFGCSVKTSKGEKFVVVKPDFRDHLVKKIKRGAQIIHKKDAGLIISYLGITKDSVVLEAGSGTGYLTAYLGSICKKVISCEIRESHFKLAYENIKMLGLDNVECINTDVCDAPKNEYDAIILDMPDEQDIIPVVCKKLKTGGRIAVYSPCVDQSMLVYHTLCENGFVNIEFLECMIRKWKVGRGTRPETMMLGHTGFIVFARYKG